MRAIWNKDSQSYSMKFKSKANANYNTYLTFDTGAGVTILCLNVLLNEQLFTTNNSLAIFNMLNVSRVKPRVFYSASKTKMSGFPCYMENVVLSGKNLSKFYFYLFVGLDNPNVSLLCNDFISCCAFNKKLNGDIVITDFDFKSYEENFIKDAESDVIFPISSIFNEVERVESTKDIASAFRYFIENAQRL